jgi:predicted nucleotidyltransferase
MPYGLKPDTIAKINGIMAAHPEIEQAILYGSRAKGNYREGSDIDLCLVVETLTLTQLLKIENELDDLLLPYKIDLSLFHALDSTTLVEHVHRVGVVFYEKRRGTDCAFSN